MTRAEIQCRKCGAPLLKQDPMNPDLIVNMDTKARDGLCKKCKDQRNRGGKKGKRF